MFGTLKKVFGVGQPVESSCAGCDPAILSKCLSAEAGSVTPHAFHVFVRIPPPHGTPSVSGEDWWPERVEDEVPAIASLVGAIKDAGERIHGKVKVTAFDYVQPSEQQAPATCDLYLFPDGTLYKNLQLEALNATAVAALAAATFQRTRGGTAPSEEQTAAAVGAGTRVVGSTLFVCCHGSRDKRCGHVGPPLAAKLVEAVGQKGLDGGITVLKTSHIGGHVYAGNVIVFSHGKEYHGDWFGGVRADNAAAFLDALLNCKSPSGAPGDYTLRSWWRGRIGMTKEQQMQCFKKGLRDIEEIGIE